VNDVSTDWAQYKMVAVIEDRTFDRSIVVWESPPYMNRIVRPMNIKYGRRYILYAEWSTDNEDCTGQLYNVHIYNH